MTCDLCKSNESNSVVIWDKAEREKQGKLRSAIIPGHIHSRNVMCRKCGLIYASPKMSKAELDKFYAEDYRKIYGGEQSLDAEKRHANNAFDILMELGDLPHVKTLDIGCSTGMLLELINRFADEQVAYGVEPNNDHYEIAKSKGLNVENCTIENYNPGFKFDIITMLNALEHVHSPTEVLTKIGSLLNDDGYVLISVPNVCNKTINLPVDTFLSNAHIYNFSPVTITALFNKCGFKVLNIYSIVEEIGEKLYVLGQKGNVEFKLPTLKDEAIEITKQHLEMADKVFETKKEILKMGFQ